MLWVRCVSAALVVALLIGGCGADENSSAPDTASTATSTAVAPTASAPVDPASMTPVDLAAAACERNGEGVEGEEVGRLQNPTLVETSGLVASAKNPGVLWANNDSGGEPVVYALGIDGTDRGPWEITGAEARDWEDLASWYDAEADEHYLYLADIGDNASQRDSVTVYRVAEPTVGETGGGATDRADEYELVYPDGPHDAETFLVDPQDGSWYILTKGWGTGISRVFRATAPRPGATTTLEDVGVSVNLKDLGSYATAGDANGLVVVRTYDEVVVWPLEGSVAEALGAEPCVGPSADEPQGEAIAVAPDRSGYYTISEGANAPIYWFPFT